MNSLPLGGKKTYRFGSKWRWVNYDRIKKITRLTLKEYVWLNLRFMYLNCKKIYNNIKNKNNDNDDNSNNYPVLTNIYLSFLINI